jgi:hypothetical protein
VEVKCLHSDGAPDFPALVPRFEFRNAL